MLQIRLQWKMTSRGILWSLHTTQVSFAWEVGRAARLQQLRTRNASFGRLPRDVETVLAWLSHLGTSSEW